MIIQGGSFVLTDTLKTVATSSMGSNFTWMMRRERGKSGVVSWGRREGLFVGAFGTSLLPSPSSVHLPLHCHSKNPTTRLYPLYLEFQGEYKRDEHLKWWSSQCLRKLPGDNAWRFGHTEHVELCDFPAQILVRMWPVEITRLFSYRLMWDTWHVQKSAEFSPSWTENTWSLHRTMVTLFKRMTWMTIKAIYSHLQSWKFDRIR